MVRNRTLRLISDVESLLEKRLPSGWIDSLNWADEEKSKTSFFEGQQKLENLENSLFVLFSKTVIQGDHLRFSSSGIEGLLNKCACEMVEGDNPSKNLLQSRYQQTLKDLRSAILLTKFHFDITSECFSSSYSNQQIINFIEVEQSGRNRISWVSILDTIIEICNFEYKFSYDQDKIRELLVCREQLLKSKKGTDDIDVLQCIECAIKKVNMVLLKLSHFAKDKKIEYKYNFVSTVVNPADMSSVSTEDYYNYLKFIDPENNIIELDVYTWQTHDGNKWARLGQMVLLMRYYTKVTKSLKQAQTLLNEYEEFYKEKKNAVFYKFNNYALRSVRVYMHNCLFSLKCKNPDTYDFNAINSNLKDIKIVQNECMIHNYHPYKKAVEYAIASIKKDIECKAAKEKIQKKFGQLKLWQLSYRENIDWCCQNQRYAFQLTFRECTEIGKDYKVFHPSSFSRPLNFRDIYKKRDEIELRIFMLENELSKYDEILSIKDAQEKINNMERKNMEQMGLFITLTTFLVGLLSIFIGNNGQVSIVEKIRYVIALGLILLVFVCVGYFVIQGKNSNVKSVIIGSLLGISTVTILGICWTPINNNVWNIFKTSTQNEHKIDGDSVSNQTIIKQQNINKQGSDGQVH